MQLERQISDLQAMRASQWLEVLKEGRPEDEKAFRAWLRESPVHIREFLELSCVERELNVLQFDREEDQDALLREINPQIVSLPRGRRGPGNARQRRMQLSRWGWAFGLAAAVCALAVGWSVYLGLPDREYTTQVGEQRTVELGDQSVITLNTDSQVRIDFERHARDVELRQGEAVFKVAHDPQRPFRVHTRAGVIQAVGTQFNVYDRIEGTDVAVLEGRVRVTAPHASAELRAGEEARINFDGTIHRAERPDVERVVAWSKRRLKFDQAPLEEIVHEFNRYHRNVRLQLEGIPVSERRYTGIFDADDPGTLARFLEQEPDLFVTRSDERIVIRSREPTADPSSGTATPSNAQAREPIPAQ